MVATIDYKRSCSPVFHGIPVLNINQFSKDVVQLNFRLSAGNCTRKRHLRRYRLGNFVNFFKNFICQNMCERLVQCLTSFMTV